jgi:hypothetical protein
MWGVNDEKEINHTITELQNRVAEIVKPVSEQLLHGEIEPIEFFEKPVLTKSGKERLIAWHNSIIKDEAGVIVGTLSSGEDITAPEPKPAK